MVRGHKPKKTPIFQKIEIQTEKLTKVTSEIYTIGTQFYHRMKLFWSSCFDEKIIMIAVSVQKLGSFFVEKMSNLADFGLFWYRDLYREYTNVKISL